MAVSACRPRHTCAATQAPPRQQEHRDACANHGTKAEEYCRDTRVHDRAVLYDKVVVAWYKSVRFVLQDQSAAPLGIAISKQ